MVLGHVLYGLQGAMLGHVLSGLRWVDSADLVFVGLGFDETSAASAS